MFCRSGIDITHGDGWQNRMKMLFPNHKYVCFTVVSFILVYVDSETVKNDSSHNLADNNS